MATFCSQAACLAHELYIMKSAMASACHGKFSHAVAWRFGNGGDLSSRSMDWLHHHYIEATFAPKVLLSCKHLTCPLLRDGKQSNVLINDFCRHFVLYTPLLWQQQLTITFINRTLVHHNINHQERDRWNFWSLKLNMCAVTSIFAAVCNCSFAMYITNAIMQPSTL